MTGFSAPCKKARPLAAPIAIFILVPHGNDIESPVVKQIVSTVKQLKPQYVTNVEIYLGENVMKKLLLFYIYIVRKIK